VFVFLKPHFLVTSFCKDVELSNLATLTNLVLLNINGLRNKFDCNFIAACTKLKHFKLMFNSLQNANSLTKLTSVTLLDLSMCDGFDNIDFLKGWKCLKSLVVRDTDVKVCLLNHITKSSDQDRVGCMRMRGRTRRKRRRRRGGEKRNS